MSERMNGFEALQAMLKGNRVQCTMNSITSFLEIKDGQIVTEEGYPTGLYIKDITGGGKHYILYKEPPKDLTNMIGRLCWMWNGSDFNNERSLEVLKEIKNCDYRPFYSFSGRSYRDCRLATEEEIQQYTGKED